MFPECDRSGEGGSSSVDSRNRSRACSLGFTIGVVDPFSGLSEGNGTSGYRSDEPLTGDTFGLRDRGIAKLGFSGSSYSRNRGAAKLASDGRSYS